MFIRLIQASLTSSVKEATGMGFRLEVHAIGDAAAEAVIKAFEDANVSPEKRPLLTHAQVCTIYLNFYKINHPGGIFGTLVGFSNGKSGPRPTRIPKVGYLLGYNVLVVNIVL